MELFIRSVEAVSVNVLTETSDLDRQLREERYYEITKPEPYKNTLVFELKGFFRGCENVFQIKSATYREHRAKIAFAIFFFNQASGLN